MNLPDDDDLLVEELTVAISKAIARKPAHTHKARGNEACSTCPEIAARAVVGYLDRWTRLVENDRIAPDELHRLRRAVANMPYGHASNWSACGVLARDPKQPTIGDLLTDLEALRERLARAAAVDAERSRRLRVYEGWHDAVRDLAASALDRIPPVDPEEGNEHG